MRLAFVLATAALLVACDGQARDPDKKRADPHSGFPAADRPVASIVSARWSTEEARDRMKEAD